MDTNKGVKGKNEVNGFNIFIINIEPTLAATLPRQMKFYQQLMKMKFLRLLEI